MTTSDVLTDGVRSAAAVTEELRQGSGVTGEPVPPPAPPPAPELSTKELRARAKADSKAVWQRRKSSAWAKAKGLNRGYLVGGGVIVGLVFAANSCRSYNLELAEIKASSTPNVAQPTGAQEPLAPVYDGMPNPLDSMLLSDQARYFIGERPTEDGSRAPMPVLRSAQVIAQIMDMQDLCELYIMLGDGARPLVLTEPAPSATRLMHESACADETAKGAGRAPATTTTASTVAVAAG